MGGLIIRCALQYLEQYQSKFHLFMTLSSPHLGYMYHSSKIVDAGNLEFLLFNNLSKACGFLRNGERVEVYKNLL